MTTKEEKQLKRNGGTHQKGNLSSFSTWMLNYRREEATTSKSNIANKKTNHLRLGGKNQPLK